jgi:uncharacterized protein involved in outer membrane biogenesis
MMKKIILISVAVVIIIVILLVAGFSNIGPIIKSAVNTYGPRMTMTDVRLGDVGISLFSGEAKLKDFYLGNPKGFKSPYAMNVRSIYVDLDEKSLTGDTIIIDKIEVVGPEITYEKAIGTDNLKTILDNVKKSMGKGKGSKKQRGKEGEGKKILVRDLIIRDGTVTLAASVLGGTGISAPLPDIHLKNLGKERNGLSYAEAFREVWATVYEKITSPAVMDILNQGLAGLGSSVEAVGGGAKEALDTIGEGAGKELEAVTDTVKGLFGK